MIGRTSQTVTWRSYNIGGDSVGQDGFRQVLGIAEDHKEDKSGWSSFLKHLKDRGLRGVKLIISDACMGLVESAAEYFPEARWQRCTVHFYRNVFSVVPTRHVRTVSDMLKALHASEDREAALAKAEAVIEKLGTMRLKEAAAKVREGIEDPDQQPAEADHAGDSARNTGGWHLSRWEISIDAGCGPAAVHCRHAVGNETLPENGLAAGSRRCRDLLGMNLDRRHRRTKVRKILDTTRGPQSPCPKSPRILFLRSNSSFQ